MKRYLLTLLVTGSCFFAKAQAVFTYGPHQVSKDEFWRAFTKNNTGTVTTQAVRDYLDLYIRFKLKVQSALDARMDTLPNLKNDIAGFRAQIIDQYMRQQSFTRKLVAEAIERNATELELAHVFVAFEKDSAAAKHQIDKAWAALKGGADFGKTAIQYSNFNYVKATSGYIGFITALALPYELENTVYALTPGNYSNPVKGQQGWHIFKLLQKRPNIGTMKAAHILFAFPPEATQEEKAAISKLADSVYKELQKGASFDDMALRFSNDPNTYATGGVLPEFGADRYTAAFTAAAFGISQDQGIAAPVQTSNGIHIIKRLQRVPAATDSKDLQVLQQWTDKVNADARINIAALRMKEEMKIASGYKPIPYKPIQLWRLTDSMLAAKNYASFFTANKQKPLFKLNQQTVTVADWLQFAKSQRTAPAAANLDGYATLMQLFIDQAVEQYYKDRLEQMNPDFAFQLKEFREGSLLFEVMERNIWSKAPLDSVGLQQYYQQHASKYKWQPSVDAIIFNCADTAIGNQAMEMMKQDVSRWKFYMDDLGGMALADSGRFEYAQLPVQQPASLKKGMFTRVETNSNDGSASFCYIVNMYPGGEQRSFDEAKGLVINDYQLLLEEKWIEQLRKKYPVTVNEAVVKTLR